MSSLYVSRSKNQIVKWSALPDMWVSRTSCQKSESKGFVQETDARYGLEWVEISFGSPLILGVVYANLYRVLRLRSLHIRKRRNIRIHSKCLFSFELGKIQENQNLGPISVSDTLNFIWSFHLEGGPIFCKLFSVRTKTLFW